MTAEWMETRPAKSRFDPAEMGRKESGRFLRPLSFFGIIGLLLPGFFHGLRLNCLGSAE
jgi:hypothetical protein